MAKFHCTRYPSLRVLIPGGGSVKFRDGEADVTDADAQKVLREHKLVKKGPLPKDDDAESAGTASDGSVSTDAEAAKEAASK